MEDFAARLEAAMPNPVSIIIGLKDSLGLTADQVTRLQGISDTLDAALKVAGDSLHAVLDRAGPNREPGGVVGRLRRHLQAGRPQIDDAVAKARRVRTAEQEGQGPAA